MCAAACSLWSRSEPRRWRSGSCSPGSWPIRCHAHSGSWRDGEARGGRRSRGSRRAERPERDAGGRGRLQRHDRAARRRPRGPARVRRQRIPPAANSADRAAAAARIGGREGRQPRAGARAGRSRAGGRAPRPPAEHAAHARPGGPDPASGRLVSLGLAAKHAHERWEARSEQQERRLELTPGDDVVVHASEEDLAIVLDNLVENALHYSPPGGAVTIEFGREGEQAYLAVLDEGPGLAEGEEEALFERFARGSASQGGPQEPGSALRSCRRSRSAGAGRRRSGRGPKAAPGRRSGCPRAAPRHRTASRTLP